MPVTQTSFDNIKVGYISETDGYVKNISISDANALTTGSMIYAHSNSSSTGTRRLMIISNDHTSAVNVTPLFIQNDGGGKCIETNGGGIFVNESANANMSLGITINQGGHDDEILNFKSEGDIAHGTTDITETDSYAMFKKYSASEGGLAIHGLSEGERPMVLYGYGSAGDAPSNGTGVDKGHIQSIALTRSGTGTTNVGSDQTTFVHRVAKGGAVVATFMLDEDGDIHADGSTSITGYDYAEFFEWKDGNPDNEDRVGYSVALDGEKIKIAEEGDTPIGIVSARPGVIGDNPMGWHGKWKQDEWGRKIPKEVDWVKWEYDYEAGERYKEGDDLPEGKKVGDVIKSRIIKKKYQAKIEDVPKDMEIPSDAVYYKGYESQHSDEYDDSKKYVMREGRQEWSPIGLMGKLLMRKGQKVASSWIKMKDVSDDIEKWLVK